ncbi:unnamed protein product [Adineta ricciae]|uniref:Uncharacterized protein n=1 Tax=Adineta ricciae TaxID=249248 RepID=A0A814PKY2_ADIRI|nr:unnamed protein product [Adineta ricciae]CAF1107404.1 unnamed protein product [Adineta ricciae]
MLKILINDYQKQHEEKFYPVVQELLKAQRELQEVKGKLEELQSRGMASSSSDLQTLPSTITLFVQYNGFFNQLCDIQKSMTTENLLIKLRHLAGIPSDRSIRLRVFSEDGLKTLFFITNDVNRTVESYNDRLAARMILSIEDTDDNDDDDNNDDDASSKQGSEKGRRPNGFQRSKSTTSSERTYSFEESDV